MGKMATLGSRDPLHIARWVEALHRGRRNAPRCSAVRSDGAPCQRPRMRNATRCPVHCKGTERDRADASDRERLLRQAVWDNGVGRKARQRLENIERRRLYRAWAKDPTLEGRTVILSAADEVKVGNYLLIEHGIALDGICILTGALFTPRAVDRLRWCGIHALSGHIDAAAAHQRLACILKDEVHQAGGLRR